MQLKTKVIKGSNRDMLVNLNDDKITLSDSLNTSVSHDNEIYNCDHDTYIDTLSYSDDDIHFLTFVERMSCVYNNLNDKNTLSPSYYSLFKTMLYLKSITKLSFIEAIDEVQKTSQKYYNLDHSKHFTNLIYIKYLTNYRFDCFTVSMLHARHLKMRKIPFKYVIGATTISPHLHTWIEVDYKPFLDVSCTQYISIFEIRVDV